MAGKIATAIAKYNANGANQDAAHHAGAFSTAPSRPVAQETHLSDYWEVLKRRRWVVISIFILIVGVVSVFSFLATPQYQATVQVLLGGQPTPMNPMGENSQRLPERNLYFRTQVNLLSNRTLARRVIHDLGLATTYAMATDSGSILPTTSVQLTENSHAAQAHEQTDHMFNAKVLMWYQKNLTVTPVRDSSLVNVSFHGPDAELVTRVVNRHAQVAIENTIKRHQFHAKDALDWLKAQIEAQKQTVHLSQRQIYEFKKKHNVLSLEDSQIIFSQEMRELNSALTKAKSDRISRRAAYLQLQDLTKEKKDVLQMPEISNYSVIQNLRNQLVDLKSKQIEMGTKYGPKHPRMRELTRGIAQIKREIQKEVRRLKNTIKAELDRAEAIEQSITRALAKQKQIAMALGERAIEYDVLKQEAESAQDIYDFLLKQSEELGLSSAISSSNMRIVDHAEIPITPVSPNIKMNILLATVLSLFLGTGTAFFLEYLDNTVKTPLEVAIRLNLPVLGMIPFHKSWRGKNSHVGLIEDMRTTDGGMASSTPLYHISNRLPAELRLPSDGLYGRVLIMESVTMGEGKTTVVSRIASNLTDAGLRVLMVDCDFQRPSLNRIFNVPNRGGLGKAIDHIMSHRISRGTLNQYSVDDLFFLMALKKQSGHLMVKNPDQAFIAHFQNGTLVHLQNQNNPIDQRIGTMLLKGGFITESQLNDALKRHQRTGQPLGYILVNAGYINRDKMRGPLRLQIEEYIQKLFSWRSGQFAFNPGVIQMYDNEKIFFEEDFSPLMNSLGRTGSSKFIEKELFSHIVALEKDNLFLLPAGTSHKLIGSLNQILMKKIFEKLKQRFDVVLIDTPPLDAASGIESIFQLADGIVLVVKAGHLSVKILNGAVNHLPKDKIIGTVLNQARINPQPYYY